MIQTYQPTQSQISIKKQKTKQDYSRNVKKLKYKLSKIQTQIQYLEQRIQSFENLSNDHVISMKISKFCKERRFTPEMLFRFADSKCKNTVSRADFKKTFNQIGLKLTQHQLTRLQYLLDQDISGQISWQQYNKYLYAFGIKKQYNPQDPFIKNALKKLDLNKILQISKQNDNDTSKKHRNLLNYQQFIKYCHKHFPSISDKQLATIFNKLQRNQLIDLEDLINYLKNIQEQRRRIQQKNKKRQQKAKKGKQQKHHEQWKVQEEQQTIDIDTLKGKYLAVLQFHPKEQRSFHSSEFKRVQTSFNCKKGEMVALFKAIDKKLHGSVGYNQLIKYYVQIQIYKNDQKSVKFAFQLMGKKMVSQGQKPQSLVQTYSNKQKQFITPEQFQKLCTMQFELIPSQANYLYSIMIKHRPLKQNSKYVEVGTFIELMKLSNINRPVVKPSLWGVFSNHFYSKHYITICTDGMITFRLCNSISEQLHAMRIKKWDDFQFGPSFQDQSGFDSIKMNAANPNRIRWLRTDQLGMKDFYIPSTKQEKSFQTSSLCSSDLFHKSLQLLINQNPYFLNIPEKQVIKTGKNIQQSQLNKLFAGLHPLVFHDFQQWGIYVVKFYIKGRWVYVIVDNKIPCQMDGQNTQPLFSYSSKRNCSYISLIQKAYAKLKGSYQKIFQNPSFNKYINQLSSFLSYDFQIQPMQNQRQNTNQWNQIKSQTSFQYQKQQFKLYQQKKQSYSKSFTGNLILPNRKIRTDQKSGLERNGLVKTLFSMDFVDQSNKENGRLHKLVICEVNSAEQLEEQKGWNTEWYTKSQKYTKYFNTISKMVNQWNKQNQIPKINLNSPKTLILNYQLMQQLFNSLFIIKTVSFQGSMNIMRKTLQFQPNIPCVYKINSTDPNKYAKLIIVLNKIRSPQDAILSIKMKQSSTNKQSKAKDPSNFYQSFKKQFIIKSDFSSTCHFISQQQQDIQIKVQNFKPNQQYIYQLTFYFDNPRFSLKQRDRHLLFRYVSEFQEHPRINFGILEVKEKQYFYSRYFGNAARRGILGCC